MYDRIGWTGYGPGPPVECVEPFDHDVHRLGSALVVTVGGEIDLLTAPAFAHCLLENMPGAPVLVADLGAVGFMGACGVEVLREVADRAVAQGVALRLVAGTAVRATLRATRMLGEFEMYPSTEDAAAGRADPRGRAIS